MDNPFEEYVNSIAPDDPVDLTDAISAWWGSSELEDAADEIKDLQKEWDDFMGELPGARRAYDCIITFEDGTEYDIGDAWLLPLDDDDKDDSDATGESDG